MDGVAELRRRRGLSVAELGRVAGVSPKTIKDVEAGRVVPKRRTVERLAEGLRVDPAGVAVFARALGLAPETDGAAPTDAAG